MSTQQPSGDAIKQYDRQRGKYDEDLTDLELDVRDAIEISSRQRMHGNPEARFVIAHLADLGYSITRGDTR